MLPSQGISAIIRVFTTQAETIFGVSFLALSPDHELLQRKEFFTESALRVVEDMKKNPSINTIDANNRPKKGLQHLVFLVVYPIL